MASDSKPASCAPWLYSSYVLRHASTERIQGRHKGRNHVVTDEAEIRVALPLGERRSPCTVHHVVRGSQHDSNSVPQPPRLVFHDLGVPLHAVRHAPCTTAAVHTECQCPPTSGPLHSQTTHAFKTTTLQPGSAQSSTSMDCVSDSFVDRTRSSVASGAA